MAIETFLGPKTWARRHMRPGLCCGALFFLMIVLGWCPGYYVGAGGELYRNPATVSCKWELHIALTFLRPCVVSVSPLPSLLLWPATPLSASQVLRNSCLVIHCICVQNAENLAKRDALTVFMPRMRAPASRRSFFSV